MDGDSSSDEENVNFENSSEESLNEETLSESEEEVRMRNKKRIKLDKKNLSPHLNKLKWSPKLCGIVPESFNQNIGPVHDLPPGSKEEDFLSLFLDEHFYDMVAVETNKYAQYRQSSEEKLDSNWREVSAREIKAYIGILIFMGVVDLPNIEDYFNSDFCDCPLVRNSMSCKRFQKISQYLHLNDEAQRPKANDSNFDPLYKVRPVLDLTEKYQKHLLPGRHLAIDEAMIGFKGRLSFKQYMPKKPTKWGIKVWVIADSASGYVLKMTIYLGKKNPKNNNFLLGEQVVLDLGKNYFKKNHFLYFDNFFTSLKLLQILFEEETYACGTFRNGRKDWPTELSKQKNKKLKPGESKILQSGQFTAILWHDKRDVRMLASGVDPTVSTSKNKKEKNISCPLAIKQYCENMGGVDLADQKRSYYPVGRPSNKWWKYVLNFVLDTAIINSFTLFEFANRPHPTAHGTRQLDFRKNLAEQLIGDYTSRSRFSQDNFCMPSRSNSLNLPQSNSTHHLMKNENSRKCRACKSLGQVKRTYFMCQECDIPLCKDQFVAYHKNINLRV